MTPFASGSGRTTASVRGRPIRIMHVITSLGKGGAETMLANLLAHRRRSGFEHFVVSLTGEGFHGPLIRNTGVPVLALRLKDPAAAPASALKALAATVRFRPDVLQGWMYHGNVAASLLRIRGCGRAQVFWNVRHSLHFFGGETLPARMVIRLNRLLSRGAACCIFNSRTSLAQHAAFGFAANAMVTVPNGFDTERFRPDPHARDAVRSRLGLARDELVVGLVGRYHPLKDYGGYLKALALLRAAAPHRAFVSLMAGKGLSRENGELRAALDALPPGGRVLLLGERDDVPALLNACDVFCLPSRSEAFPNVVGEAMAAGLPCLVTDVGDAAHLAGGTGVVVAPRDPRALAGGLERVMGWDPSERARRGAEARARIQSLFSIGAVVERYERLYEDAAGGSG